MAVDQGRRGAGHGGRFRVHQGVSGRRNHFGGEPQVAKLVGHPVGPAKHVVAMARIALTLGISQKLAQFALEPGGVSIQVLVDRGHNRDFRCSVGSEEQGSGARAQGPEYKAATIPF